MNAETAPVFLPDPPLTLPAIPDVSPAATYVAAFLACFVAGCIARTVVRRVRAA